MIVELVVNCWNSGSGVLVFFSTRFEGFEVWSDACDCEGWRRLSCGSRMFCVAVDFLRYSLRVWRLFQLAGLQRSLGLGKRN